MAQPALREPDKVTLGAATPNDNASSYIERPGHDVGIKPGIGAGWASEAARR